MTKTNITIICSTIIPIFVIGIIAVLLWVFRKEVMELWGKLKEKCGEWIGGEKKVSNALDDVEVGSGKNVNDKCDYCEEFENAKQGARGALNEIHDINREMIENNKKIKDNVNKILNILEKKINREELNGK